MRQISESHHFKKKERELLSCCREAIHKISPDATVILYGSRARGDSEAESDYDLLVLVNRAVSLEQEDVIRGQLYKIELYTGRVITLNVYHDKDWESSLYHAMPFHQNVERDGVVI